MGTYLLRPVINDYILPGNIPGLVVAIPADGRHVSGWRARDLRIQPVDVTHGSAGGQRDSGRSFPAYTNAAVELF